MSDISIRLDGLALLAAIALGVLTYSGIGLIAGIRWIANRTAHTRSGRIAGYALAAAAVQAIVFAVAFPIADTAHSGPDVVDWFTIPYALGCIAGYVALARTA